VDVSTNLKLTMLVAGILTIVFEFVMLRFLLGLAGIPIVSVFPFLGVFFLFQWLIGPLLLSRNLVEVHRGDPQYGWLYDMVANLAYAAGFKTPPKVFIADEPFPNAFAFGNVIVGNRVAVTVPLINIATPEELRAVIGHELGHLKHKDVEIGIAIGLIPTAIGYISWMLLDAGLAILSIAASEADLLVGIASLAIGGFLYAITIFLQVFVLWFNRLRESYADLHSFELLGRDSAHLATALAKIVIYMQKVKLDPFRGVVVTANAVRIPTNEPYELVRKWLNEKTSFFMDFFSTHPHPARRVQMLQKLLLKYGFTL
jgi:heat shock protein HtpX